MCAQFLWVCSKKSTRVLGSSVNSRKNLLPFGIFGLHLTCHAKRLRLRRITANEILLLPEAIEEKSVKKNARDLA